MQILQGKYGQAIVYADQIDLKAKEQILEFCNLEISSETQVAIMPDVHVGVGCVIGMTVSNMSVVAPYMVGVDIGCGVLAVRVKTIRSLNLSRIDQYIRENIPHGFKINDRMVMPYPFENFKCYEHLKNVDRLERSLGSLGGGNHFIEINTDDAGRLYLCVHTGSRNLGKQVAEHYQEKAVQKLKNTNNQKVPKNLAYLEGKDKSDYLWDMAMVQNYAKKNREIISRQIIENCGFEASCEAIDTKHNYIDIESNILRKGAVSSKKDEMLIIPMNMRDGSFICKGKGIEAWNYSAPHGAGRLLSRRDAKKKLKLEDMIEQMKDVYTTSLNKSTLDEAPDVYKSSIELRKSIQETAEVISIIKPIYNFKSDA